MKGYQTSCSASGAAEKRQRNPRCWAYRIGAILVLFIGLLALFYTWENYRSERAWQILKRDLVAQGQRLDPEAFVLPPVPDAQNFLKAAPIRDWFTFSSRAPGTSPTENLIRITQPGDADLLGSWSKSRPTDLEEWRKYFRRGQSRPAPANESDEFVPLIVIDSVPFVDALRNLTRQANIEVSFDNRVYAMTLEGTPLLQVPVSVRFENVTAREALKAVLGNYGLALMKTPTPSQFQIIRALAPAPVWPHEAADIATLTLPPAADERVTVIIDGVPVMDAIRHVAKQAGIIFIFDPEVSQLVSPAGYSLELTNTTPRNAFNRVLEDNGLALKAEHGSAIFRVVPAHKVMPAHAPRSAPEVLESFNQFTNEFRALYAACERPQSWIDTDYRGLLTEYPHYFYFKGYGQVIQALTLHASAELALNNSSVAFQDATVLYRLATMLKRQPSLTSAMMQVAATGLYLQVVWEGLAARRWDDSQLRMFEEQLATFDLLADCATGFEAEQAAINWWFEHTPQRELVAMYFDQMQSFGRLGQTRPMWCDWATWALRWGPRGWIRQMQIGYAQSIQNNLGQLDLRYQRVLPPHSSVANAIRKFSQDTHLPVAALVRRYGHNYVKAVEVTARQQTGVNQARIACALERYRLAYGDFPDDLDQLVPQFLDRTPHDLMTGQSLNYRHIKDEQFVLYSVGWDEQDDAASGTDWVWRYPALPRSVRNLAMIAGGEE